MLKNCWLIGDNFLTEIYHELSSMKSAAFAEKKRPPFIYQYFNVSTFTTNPLSVLDDVLARLINCFIKGLNDNVHLPGLLIVIPDQDILNFFEHFIDIGNSKDVRTLTEIGINWLATQIDRAIDIRKDHLQIRNLSAVVLNEPKIIWIKALGRMKSHKEAMAKFDFNSKMCDVLSRRKNHLVMDVQHALANITDFTKFGDLCGVGKLRFWNEFNRQLELFELKDVDLIPMARASSDNIAHDPNRSDGFNSNRESESRGNHNSNYHPRHGRREDRRHIVQRHRTDRFNSSTWCPWHKDRRDHFNRR